MTVGSGIGGALIIGDRIYRGFGKGAGEIGHLRVIDASRPGARLDELERVASGWAIADGRPESCTQDRGGGGDWIVLDRVPATRAGITTDLVAEAAQEGDAESSVDPGPRHAAIAFALVQAITLVAPRRIVIGGGVSLIGEAGGSSRFVASSCRMCSPHSAEVSISSRPRSARKWSSMVPWPWHAMRSPTGHVEIPHHSSRYGDSITARPPVVPTSYSCRSLTRLKPSIHNWVDAANVSSPTCEPNPEGFV